MTDFTSIALKPEDRSKLFARGGKIGARMMARDWASSRVGSLESWPQSLWFGLNLCFASPLPTLLLWGQTLDTFFNDAAQELLGELARGLAQPVADVLPQVGLALLPRLQTLKEMGSGVELDHTFSMDGPQTARQPARLICTPVAGNDGSFGGVLVQMQCDRTVCDRKQVTADLKEANQILGSVINGIQDLIFVKDRRGRYIIVNQAAADWLGQHLSAVISQSDHALFPPEIARHIVSTDRQVIQTGEATSFEEQIFRCGELRSLMTRKYPWRNEQGQIVGVIGICRDITSSKRSEAALRLSERRYRTLINAVPQLMWVSDSQGRIEYLNQRWHEFISDGSKFNTESWQQIIHPQDFELACQGRDNAIRHRQPYQVEIRLKRSDGSYRWHLARVVPLQDENQQILNWFGTATDIHDQKQALMERDQALRRERAAREEAEAVNRIKDEFLAVLSHELRSPLNPILGWSSILKQRRVEEKTLQKAFETIERNVRLQLQLVDDLLDVSSILRGKLSLEKAAVDLQSVIQGAIETVQLAAEAKSINLVTNLPPTNGTILGDEGRIQQILWNLLSNAVKFTPPQGQVDIQLNLTNQEAQIQVRDTGKGISPDFMPHVFEYFRQEDAATTRRFGGLGLGLAIVRYLSEMHGGSVTVDSPGEGQGSTFLVQLPLLKKSPSSSNKGLSDTELIDLSGVRVLIVEGHPDSRDFMVYFLRNKGAQVTAVGSVVAALSYLKNSPPDVLVSDITMPDIDGYTLLHQLRQAERQLKRFTRSPRADRPIPAIALTACASSISMHAAEIAGFERHLPKPVDGQTLARTVLELVCPH